MIQGSSATMTKLAGILMYNYRWDNNLTKLYKVPLYVHDEVLVMTKKVNSKEVAKIVEASMKKAGAIMFKRVPMNAGAVISNVWEH